MKKLITLMIITTSLSVFSSDKKLKLGDWVNDELMETQNSMRSVSEDNEMDMKLKTIRFRLRPSIGIEIDFIAKAKIRPEVEIFWSK